MRKVLACLFGLVLMFGVVAVGDGNAKETKKLASATIKFWFPSEGELNDKYFWDAAKEFEAKNPGVKVEITKLPTAGPDITMKLNAAALSGDYPDVLSIYLASLGIRGSKGEFADLSPYFNKWPDRSDFQKSSIDMGIIQKKQLGIGFFPSPLILTYRADYFKEAGLDPAKPPLTWEDIKNYANKLVKKDASGKVVRAGMDIPAINVDVTLYAFMRQGGSLVVNEKANKPSCSDKGAVAAVDFMVGLKNQTIPFDGEKKNEYPFMKGYAAMSLLNPSQINSFIINNPALRDKVAFAPITKGTKQIAFCGNRFFCMGANSKYKAQSAEFIKFMLSKEQMWKRAKEINVPVVRKSLETQYIALNPALNTAIMEYASKGKGNPMVPWFTSFNKYAKTAYEEVYTGRKPAKQALREVEANTSKDLNTVLGK